MKRFILVMVLLLSCSAWCWALKTERANILVSITETKSSTSEAWTGSWNYNGHFTAPAKQWLFDLTVRSDYSRASDDTTFDRLKTEWRFIGLNEKSIKPVLLIQTEGDHFGRNSLNALVAFGARRQFKSGYVELTVGASKDLTTGESWAGDSGLEFAYEKQLSKRLKMKTGPKGQFGTFGQARLRQDRIRYSWDLALDYQISAKYALGYRLWFGNTLPNAQRTQWLGLSRNF